MTSVVLFTCETAERVIKTDLVLSCLLDIKTMQTVTTARLHDQGNLVRIGHNKVDIQVPTFYYLISR